MQSRWTLDEAILFGRRALARAIVDAKRYGERKNRDEADYWLKTTDLSTRAFVALRELIEQQQSRGLFSGIAIPSQHQRLSIRISTPQKSDKVEDLQTLKRAAAILERVMHDAKPRADHQKQFIQNEPDGAKGAFVFRLAEAWIFLTGKIPTTSRSSNPFLDFVSDAAFDAGLSEESFDSAMLAAIIIIETYNNSPLLKGQRNRQTTTGIANHGPWWEK